MSETYPIPVSEKEFKGYRDHRLLPREFNPGDQVELMMKLEQDSNLAAARMFAVFPESHKRDNIYDAAELTLLHPDPSDDESARLTFDPNNYWQPARTDEPLELVINKELVRVMGGYLLEADEEEWEEFDEARDKYLLEKAHDPYDDTAKKTCLYDGVQLRQTLALWDYGRRP